MTEKIWMKNNVSNHEYEIYKYIEDLNCKNINIQNIRL